MKRVDKRSNYHRERIEQLSFRELALRQSEQNKNLTGSKTKTKINK